MRYLAAVIWGLALGTAQAQVDPIPRTLRTDHPFLYIDGSVWNAVKARHYAPNLPAQGTLTLRFSPGRRLSAPNAGPPDIPLIEVSNGNIKLLLVKHIGDGDTADTARLQFLATGDQIAGQLKSLPYDVQVHVELTWSQTGNATLKVNGETFQLGKWGPGPTPQLKVLGRRGDQLHELSVDTLPPGTPAVDLNFQMAHYGLLQAADSFLTKTAGCDPSPAPSGVCAEIVNKGRAEITDPARDLAVAYRLTNNATYLQGALKYMRRLAAVAPDAGNDDWAIASRMAAMGLLYDYLYLETAQPLPTGSGNYRTLLSEAIRASARVPLMVKTVCGDANPLAGAGYACTVAPAFAEPYDAPTTARYYLSGHSQSANFGMALALLAIADDQPEVKPMLDTLYQHFAQGFARALDQVGRDGGYHTGFAYGSQNGELLERLMVWNRAVDGAGDPLFSPLAAATQVYPFIYGLRSDLRFPASGDHFDNFVNNSRLGQLARQAIAAGDPGPAQEFYEKQVLARRPSTSDTFSLWEEMLYGPLPGGYGTSIGSLALARAFPGSGQVVMRDRWYDPQATIVDFKSTPFISINHHHMDQNSFALYYQSPLALDSGMYDNYDTSAHWRNYYRSTFAHNTIVVLDKDAPAYGAQWPGTQPALPYLENIEATGSNALAGVTHFEDRPSYAYTQGDASKAYSYTVLQQQRGFVRDLVMLRNPGSQPTVVVFDAVRTSGAKKATSLLHFTNHVVNETVTAPFIKPGRKQFTFTNGAQRVFTTRRWVGPIGTMLTTQVLLPTDAVIVQTGGQWQADPSSVQCPQILSNGTANGVDQDCRFTAPRWNLTTNDWEWPNYVPAHLPGAPGSQISSSDDVGEHRIEISPPTAPPDGVQFFLMVLHPQPRDSSDTMVANVPRARLLTAPGDCAAVEVDERVTLVFSRSATFPSQCNWEASATGALLVTGLKPETRYAVTVASPGGTASVAESTTGTMSSKAGTLQIGL